MSIGPSSLPPSIHPSIHPVSSLSVYLSLSVCNLLNESHRFSVADVAVGAYLLYMPQFFPDINMGYWPAISGYMLRCASRPAYGPHMNLCLHFCLFTKRFPPSKTVCQLGAFVVCPKK